MKTTPIHRLYFLLVMIIWIAPGCSPNENASTGQNPESAAETLNPSNNHRKTILIFGNSLTAGFGVDPEEAYPGLLQARLDSLGLPWQVINAGVSGETTATGNNRISWVIQQQPVDIFILELGGNDGLRGIPVSETRKNLAEMVEKVKAQYPKAEIVLAGMMVPPNMGPQYSRDFEQIYPALAKEKNTLLIPFLLEGVGGIDSLNLPDGIHPTPEGHKIVLENVWKVLQHLLSPSNH